MAEPPVSLMDLKDYLNDSTSGDDDDEQRRTLYAATDAVEELVGPMVVRTATSRVYGSATGLLLLPVAPVVSVESVTNIRTAVVLDLTTVDVNVEAGTITPWYGGLVSTDPYTVAYTVGRNPVPDSLLQAVLVVAGELWASQRSSVLSRPGMLGQDASPSKAGARVGLNSAAALLEPHRRFSVA